METQGFIPVVTSLLRETLEGCGTTKATNTTKAHPILRWTSHEGEFMLH
jgi:hypothetical protein